MEDYIKSKEQQNLKDYVKIKNFIKYNKVYKDVNNAYLSHYTTLDNACKIANVSKRTYYRACEELDEKSVVQMAKEINKKNKKRNKKYDQFGGEKKYKILDEGNENKYRLTEDDVEYKKQLEYINKCIKNDINKKAL